MAHFSNFSDLFRHLLQRQFINHLLFNQVGSISKQTRRRLTAMGIIFLDTATSMFSSPDRLKQAARIACASNICPSQTKLDTGTAWKWAIGLQIQPTRQTCHRFNIKALTRHNFGDCLQMRREVLGQAPSHDIAGSSPSLTHCSYSALEIGLNRTVKPISCYKIRISFIANAVAVSLSDATTIPRGELIMDNNPDPHRVFAKNVRRAPALIRVN